MFSKNEPAKESSIIDPGETHGHPYDSRVGLAYASVPRQGGNDAWSQDLPHRHRQRIYRTSHNEGNGEKPQSSYTAEGEYQGAFRRDPEGCIKVPPKTERKTKLEKPPQDLDIETIGYPERSAPVEEQDRQEGREGHACAEAVEPQEGQEEDHNKRDYVLDHLDPCQGHKMVKGAIGRRKIAAIKKALLRGCPAKSGSRWSATESFPRSSLTPRHVFFIDKFSNGRESLHECWNWRVASGSSSFLPHQAPEPSTLGLPQKA